MNILQGTFYSTAFRVLDDRAFALDPAVLEMQKHMDMFAGKRRGTTLHVIASKDTEPKTDLEVHAAAIFGLLDDARSDVAMEDPLGWIEVLQKHLHPESGIVFDEAVGGEKILIYISADRAGWNRRANMPRS
jgi:hypothetical protein